MKTWNDLSLLQRKNAVEHFWRKEMEFVASHIPTGYDPVSGAIRNAVAKAEQNGTPWFAAQYIRDEPIGTGELSDATVGEWLLGIASEIAHTAIYLEDGENAVHISRLTEPL